MNNFIRFFVLLLALTIALSACSFGGDIPSPSGVSPSAQASKTPSETPSKTPTDPPTDAPKPAVTDTPTEKPTDKPTDPPTDPPTDAPSQTPTQTPTDTPTSNNGNSTVQDFVDALSDADIASAKAAAQAHYDAIPNQEAILGVISITFDSAITKKSVWKDFGEGLGGDPNLEKFAPGNLAVFRVNTKRYGDVDMIALGRNGAKWEVLAIGR